MRRMTVIARTLAVAACVLSGVVRGETDGIDPSAGPDAGAATLEAGTAGLEAETAGVLPYGSSHRFRSLGRGRDPRGWYLGVEATYLAPLYGQGDVSFTLVDEIAPASLSVGSDFDSAEQLTGAPRVVLGYTGQRGIGIQLRYWELNNAAGATRFPDSIVGDQLQSLGGDDSFEAYALDLELTKEFCRCGWDWLGAFGVRHAMYDRSRTGRAFGAVNGDVFTLSSSQGEAFHGTGLTFGLSGLRPVGSCRGVSLYTTNRVSPVFGSSKSRAFASSSFSGPGGTAGSVNGATGYNDDTLVILETGAGLQWSRDVRGFNGRMFARLGVEYQYWTGSGGEAFAESFSGTGGSSTGFARARAGDHDFHLIGLAVMSGFSW